MFLVLKTKGNRGISVTDKKKKTNMLKSSVDVPESDPDTDFKALKYFSGSQKLYIKEC